MRGIDSTTGKELTGIAHLRQSVWDILRTPLGSRVMRRTYGSRLFDLIDAPLNRFTIAEIYSAVVDALGTWEPRIQVESVVIASAAPGEVVLDLTGKYLPDGTDVTLNGIVIS